MERPKELFLVWQDDESEQFYNQYETLREAVAAEVKGAEVFKAQLSSLGSFEVKTKVIKRKNKK